MTITLYTLITKSKVKRLIGYKTAFMHCQHENMHGNNPENKLRNHFDASYVVSRRVRLLSGILEIGTRSRKFVSAELILAFRPPAETAG